MNIRKYKKEDCGEIIKLFYDTVHNINIKDYIDIQVNVWAKGTIYEKVLNKSLIESYTIVCEMDDEIVGFGDMTIYGYLDRLYVHKDYQGIGIATLIVDTLEEYALEIGIKVIETHASIISKSFLKNEDIKS